MGTLGSTTWPQQALTTMLPSSPATLAPMGMEPDMASRPAMPDTQEPAPTDMGILATLGMELAMLAMLAMVALTELDMVALTELDMVAMELAMVVLTELDMLAMELGTAMAILATPATVDMLAMELGMAILATPATVDMLAMELGMVQPTQVMLDIEFSARSNMDCSTVIT